jgi:hypothetical protein
LSNSTKGLYVLSKHIGINQQYHWVLKASNHEVILSGENYSSKQGAESGISSCRINSQVDARYEKRTSVAGQPYFILKAENAQVIGTSQMYSTTNARDNGIASVKQFGKDAILDDKA